MKYVTMLVLFGSLFLYADEPKSALEFMESGATCTFIYSDKESTFIESSKNPKMSLELCLNYSVCKKDNVTYRSTQMCSIENGKCPQPLECARSLKRKKDLAFKVGGGVLADDSEDSFKIRNGTKVDEYNRELKMTNGRPSVFRKKGADGQTLKFCTMVVQSTGGDANAPYLPPMIACGLKAEVTENGKTTAYCPGVYECAKNRYSSETVELAGIFKGTEGVARRTSPREKSVGSLELVHQP